MTAHKARLNGKTPKRRNRKDGASGRKRSGDRIEFTPANQWKQAWGSGLPSFSISPEPRLVEGSLLMCLVAKCDQDQNVELIFPATMDYSLMKDEIDSKMLELARDGAEHEPVDWDEMKSEGLAYDF